MRRLLPLLICLLLPSVALGQTATLSTDRVKVAVGTPFDALLTVAGGVVEGSPRLSSVEGFDIVSAGTQTSMSLSQGRLEQSSTYTFRITAAKVGELSVGPFILRVAGKTLRSNTVDVRVVSRSVAAQSTKKDAPGENWFIEADTSDSKPFAGEAFVYRLRVGSATRSRDPSFGSLESAALTSEPNVRIGQRQFRKLIDSKTWTISEILVPLFGVEPGPATIEPVDAVLPVVLAGGGLFARTREVALRSEPLDVTVRALPREGKPDNFSGTVGSFTLRGSLEPQTLEAGETATLTLVLEGDGAARNPTIALELPDSIRAYDEDPERAVQADKDGVSSRIIFRTALVPLEPGKIEIPRVVFSYFDPRVEDYATAQSPPFTLTVGGTAVADTSVTAATGLQRGKEEVEVLGSDILPLHDPASPARTRPLGLSSPLVLLFLLLPLAGWGAGEATAARLRSAGSEAGLRRGQAKDAKAARKDAKLAAADDDWEGAEAAVRRWLSARLGRGGAGAALSPGEATTVLTGAGASDELAARLSKLLERIEAARYGGAATGGLAGALLEWLTDAEKEWT
jgi:hypothetical protein